MGKVHLKTTTEHELLVQAVIQVILELCGGDESNDTQQSQFLHQLQAMIPSTILHRPDHSLIRTAAALWSRYHQRPGDGTTAKVWTFTSSLGVERVVGSARQFAEEWLLPALERHYSSSSSRVVLQLDSASAFLRVSWSKNDYYNYISSGCPLCSLRVSCCSLQSLWWHLQTSHQMEHASAIALARAHMTRMDRALVVYDASCCSATGEGSFTNLVNKEPSSSLRNPNEGSTLPTMTAATGTTTTAHPISSATASPKQQQPLDPFRHVQQSDDWMQLVVAPLGASTPGPPPTTIQKQLAHLATLRDSHGALLLHWAAGAGHLRTVQALIEQSDGNNNNNNSSASVVNAPQHGHRAYAGRTALHWAARHGRHAVVHYLVGTARANVAATTEDGTTAICWAAWQGHAAIVEYLYAQDRASSLTMRNRYGCTAALWAAQGTASVELLEWIVERSGAGWERNTVGHGILHKAAQRGRRDVCEWWVERHLYGKSVQRGDQPPQPTEASTTSTACLDDKERLLLVLEAMAPDQEGAVPSDLAGMEGHEALAHYLAKVEMDCVLLLVWNQCHLPSWLQEPYAFEPELVWENGAGVLRMRSMLGSDRRRKRQFAQHESSTIQEQDNSCFDDID